MERPSYPQWTVPEDCVRGGTRQCLPTMRIGFVVDETDPCVSNVKHIGVGGMGDVWHYVIKQKRKGSEPRTIHCAVKKCKILVDRGDAKKGVIALLTVWNEWIYLSSIATRHSVRAIGFQSKPMLPRELTDAMTHFLGSHRLGDDVKNTISWRMIEDLLRKYRLEETHTEIFMEYFPGLNLADFVDEKRGSLKISTFKLIAAQLMLAMGELHRIDVIHNDIKPTNFLIRKKDLFIKLCDFGSAAKDSEQPWNFGWTRDYVSPERLNSRIGTKESDIYGLGITLKTIAALGVDWKHHDPERRQLTALILAMTNSQANKRPPLKDIIGPSSKFGFFDDVDIEKIQHHTLMEARRVGAVYGLKEHFSLEGRTIKAVLKGSYLSPHNARFEDCIPVELATFSEMVITRTGSSPHVDINNECCYCC